MAPPAGTSLVSVHRFLPGDRHLSGQNFPASLRFVRPPLFHTGDSSGENIHIRTWLCGACDALDRVRRRRRQYIESGRPGRKSNAGIEPSREFSCNAAKHCKRITDRRVGIESQLSVRWIGHALGGPQRSRCRAARHRGLAQRCASSEHRSPSGGRDVFGVREQFGKRDHRREFNGGTSVLADVLRCGVHGTFYR